MKVVVGSEKRVFYIHKTLICLASPVFAAAFEGDFQEGLHKIVVLEDMDSEVFACVSTILYKQSRGETLLREIGGACELQNLAKIWVAADRFKMASLQTT